MFLLSEMKEEKQQVCEALEAFSRLNDKGTEGSGARARNPERSVGQRQAEEEEVVGVDLSSLWHLAAPEFN